MIERLCGHLVVVPAAEILGNGNHNVGRRREIEELVLLRASESPRKHRAHRVVASTRDTRHPACNFVLVLFSFLVLVRAAGYGFAAARGRVALVVDVAWSCSAWGTLMLDDELMSDGPRLWNLLCLDIVEILHKVGERADEIVEEQQCRLFVSRILALLVFALLGPVGDNGHSEALGKSHGVEQVVAKLRKQGAVAFAQDQKVEQSVKVLHIVKIICAQLIAQNVLMPMAAQSFCLWIDGHFVRGKMLEALAVARNVCIFEQRARGQCKSARFARRQAVQAVEHELFGKDALDSGVDAQTLCGDIGGCLGAVRGRENGCVHVCKAEQSEMRHLVHLAQRMCATIKHKCRCGDLHRR
eukprot:comp22148_c0_seq2/m.51864 comp22148_c0_seq2/g.51864  ORF comp22148_c0_seq2/g.51864 comp22148_c0_seq2/m.51864 type:complete len:356 (+) comp22148_c0_seq2:310-1377(+)